jgi:hypothetical protein
MRWRTERRSTNIEDRRSSGIPTRGSSRIPGGRATGIGGIGLIVVFILFVVLGGDPGQIIGSTDYSPESSMYQSQLSAQQQDQLADHVALVLGDTETTWAVIFEDQLGETYREPRLVLFTGYVDSACGEASAAVGPFYCPADQKVYLDLDFFYELQQQYEAPGDFAQAYVIAHEIGHHVQTLLGTTDYVNRQSRRLSEADANKLSVALELQADCYAGVWAKQAMYDDLILEPGDLEEALNAASAIGDDTLQMEYQGYVVPDSFTHGTSAQRVAWFRKGMDAGMVKDCNCPELPAVG